MKLVKSYSYIHIDAPFLVGALRSYVLRNLDVHKYLTHMKQKLFYYKKLQDKALLVTWKQLPCSYELFRLSYFHTLLRNTSWQIYCHYRSRALTTPLSYFPQLPSLVTYPLSKTMGRQESPVPCKFLRLRLLLWPIHTHRLLTRPVHLQPTTVHDFLTFALVPLI